MRQDWSDEELAASVDAYREMAQKDASGQKYSKKQVYRDLAERFGRSDKAFEYRMQNISAVLAELNMPWIAGLKPAVNVGAGVKPKLVDLIQQQAIDTSTKQFKHGNKRTWELALDAVIALGSGPVTPSAVKRWILQRYPEYNPKNLISDLAMLAVNSPSRTSYPQNERPRRTDQGSEFDRLIKVGTGPGVKFEAYDAAQHGIWEIYADVTSGNRAGMLVRQVVNPITEGLAHATKEIEQSRGFDPSDVEDARRRVYAAIIRRQGQPAFRAAQLDAYNYACAITGCKLLAVLEAAHVHPYKGDHTNVTSNGLLLRADIHTLFDLGLIAVDSASLTVQVSPKLAGSEYASLQGAPLRVPAQTCDRVSTDALDWHRSRCAW